MVDGVRHGFGLRHGGRPLWSTVFETGLVVTHIVTCLGGAHSLHSNCIFIIVHSLTSNTINYEVHFRFSLSRSMYIHSRYGTRTVVYFMSVRRKPRGGGRGGAPRDSHHSKPSSVGNSPPRGSGLTASRHSIGRALTRGGGDSHSRGRALTLRGCRCNVYEYN